MTLSIKSMLGNGTSRLVPLVFFHEHGTDLGIQSSLYMRKWALERWNEGVQVDLSKELPRLKVEIRLEREAEELRQQQEESEADREEAASLAN